MDASLGFLRERFSMSIENDILSRIIYRNDVTGRNFKIKFFYAMLKGAYRSANI